MKVRFYGVRGSIPAPVSSKQIQSKITAVIQRISAKDIVSADARENSFLNCLRGFSERQAEIHPVLNFAAMIIPKSCLMPVREFVFLENRLTNRLTKRTIFFFLICIGIIYRDFRSLTLHTHLILRWTFIPARKELRSISGRSSAVRIILPVLKNSPKTLLFVQLRREVRLWLADLLFLPAKCRILDVRSVFPFWKRKEICLCYWRGTCAVWFWFYAGARGCFP